MILNQAALRRNRTLIMRHHGLARVGATAREAISPGEEFGPAAHIRLRIEATAAAPLEIPAAFCEHIWAQYELHDRGRASAEWPAHLRQLDRIDSSDRD